VVLEVLEVAVLELAVVLAIPAGSAVFVGVAAAVVVLAESVVAGLETESRILVLIM